ncbi:MAG: glycosyltransferase [Kordia sp.]|nr:MAG: glycosyltransferase [Kordia sp.]
MLKQPLVTIICSCYNHENYVLDTLNSVIHQEYKNIQLIIVDDYSSDNSNKVITTWIINYPDTIFIQNPENLGITKSFNNAYKYAKGDYLIDLAADDILLPKCIKLQLEVFKNSNYTNLGLVYGNAIVTDDSGKFIRYYFPQNEDGSLIKQRPTGNVYEYIISDVYSLCSVTAMIKAETFEYLNGYDPDLHFEDLDFWIRASREYEFDFINLILAKKRELKNSLGDSFFKKNTYYKKFNYSVYNILNKAFALNRNKQEHKSLLKRTFIMMKRAARALDFKLFLIYVLFYSKVFYYSKIDPD